MENWPRLDMDPGKNSDGCFGCGSENPIGLKLKFKWDEKNQTASAEFTPGENFQGWPGFVHGGITACVLDEAMGWTTLAAGANNVTARIQVRYRQLAPLGKTYIVTCRITKQTSRLTETIATLSGLDGTVYAEGTSTQFLVHSNGDKYDIRSTMESR